MGRALPREVLPRILNHSSRNFNADANREFLNETGLPATTLDDAW